MKTYNRPVRRPQVSTRKERAALELSALANALGAQEFQLETQPPR